MYLIRTFKTALLLWTLGKCTLIWAASKRSIFAILVLITRFISRSSKCFSIRTTSIPIKIFLLISSSFKFLVPCFSEACRYLQCIFTFGRWTPIKSHPLSHCSSIHTTTIFGIFTCFVFWAIFMKRTNCSIKTIWTATKCCIGTRHNWFWFTPFIKYCL